MNTSYQHPVDIIEPELGEGQDMFSAREAEVVEVFLREIVEPCLPRRSHMSARKWRDGYIRFTVLMYLGDPEFYADRSEEHLASYLSIDVIDLRRRYLQPLRLAMAHASMRQAVTWFVMLVHRCLQPRTKAATMRFVSGYNRFVVYIYEYHDGLFVGMTKRELAAHLGLTQRAIMMEFDKVKTLRSK